MVYVAVPWRMLYGALLKLHKDQQKLLNNLAYKEKSGESKDCNRRSYMEESVWDCV